MNNINQSNNNKNMKINVIFKKKNKNNNNKKEWGGERNKEPCTIEITVNHSSCYKLINELLLRNSIFY